MYQYNAEDDPYFRHLPHSVVETLEKMSRSASRLTIGMIISLFFPAGFLFVIGFGIFRLAQAKELIARFPELANPAAKFPNKTKREIKALALSHRNLKKVLEFHDAQKAFWVAFIFPILLNGSFVVLLSFLN